MPRWDDETRMKVHAASSWEQFYDEGTERYYYVNQETTKTSWELSEHEGCLMKKAIKSGRNWKNRYFILSDGFLYYFSSENSPSPRGSIAINELCSIVTGKKQVEAGGGAQSFPSSFPFGIKCHKGAPALVLCALTKVRTCIPAHHYTTVPFTHSV